MQYTDDDCLIIYLNFISATLCGHGDGPMVTKDIITLLLPKCVKIFDVAMIRRLWVLPNSLRI